MKKRTVLELVKSALHRTLGATPPTSITSTSDKIQIELRELLHEVAEDVRSRGIFSQQKKMYSLELTSGRQQYPLPFDFYAPLTNTPFDQTNQFRIDGPLPDSAAQLRLYGGLTSTLNREYRVFGPDMNTVTVGGELWIFPSPSSSGDDLSFPYASSNLFLPKFWAVSTVFAASAYCSASGRIYQTSAGGTTSSSSANVPVHTSGSTSDGGVTWAHSSDPYETIVADTDICVFDDNLMMAGLKAFYLDADGQDASLDLERYERLIEKSMYRHHGSYFTSLAPLVVSGPRLPEGGYG